jgi:hypothetical protein
LETGGAAHFLADLGTLPAIYAEILEQLRSRYLLAYQPAAASGGDVYRRITVAVSRPGVEVRAREGYYP